MSTLEQAIIDIICKIYNAQFTGKLQVNKTNTGWLLKIYNVPEKPISIAFDCDSEETFLVLAEKDLKTRNFTHTDYFKGYKIDKN
jgi:hypothetical protein